MVGPSQLQEVLARKTNVSLRSKAEYKLAVAETNQGEVVDQNIDQQNFPVPRGHTQYLVQAQNFLLLAIDLLDFKELLFVSFKEVLCV